MQEKKNTKLSVIIISLAIAVVLLILLIPIRSQIKDGGSVEYKAVLYSVTNYHSKVDHVSHMEGISVKILGIEVYDSTHMVDVYESDE